MTRPPNLNAGNTIRIISTARKITQAEVAPAVEILEGWGFRVEFGQHLFAEHHQFAGTVEQRAKDLQAALDDPSVHAILCARGGYGTVQVIDRIDFSRFRHNPKWIAGYSDVTVLHTHIHQVLGIETLHATMAVNFAKNTPEALDSLHKALKGEQLDYSFPGTSRNHPGETEGELIGGNLSILYSLTGTASFPDTAGKVLFLEDLDEYLYHIDRMMMNLKRAGMLSDLAGLVCGGLTDMNDNATPYGYSAEASVERVLGDVPYPVCYDAPFGHLPDNRTLIMGRKTKLKVRPKEVRLTFVP